MLIGGFVSTVCLKSSKRAGCLKMAYFAHKGGICRDYGKTFIFIVKVVIPKCACCEWIDVRACGFLICDSKLLTAHLFFNRCSGVQRLGCIYLSRCYD